MGIAGARDLASAAEALSPAELERCRVGLASVLARGYSIHVDVEPSRKMRDTAARIVEEASPVDRDAELRSLVHELGRHDYMAAEVDQIRTGTSVQVSAPAFNDRGEVELSVGVSLRCGDGEVRRTAANVMATAGMITEPSPAGTRTDPLRDHDLPTSTLCRRMR
jgi:hypothetical protein